MSARAAVVFVAVGLGGCEVLTRSDAYQTYSGICDECPAQAGLKRPACPAIDDRAADTGDDGVSYYFAWRTVTLGDRPFDGGSDDVGYDEDCSFDLDGGVRALCVAAPLPPGNDNELIKVPPWKPLPGGVENALGQRVIKPLVDFAQGFDVDAILSNAFSGGQAGQIVVIEDWNGTGDDNAITITFVGTNGVAPDAGPPKWDGTDVWVPKSSIAGYPHYQGYVSGGVLVADTRLVGDEKLDIVLLDSNSQPQTFHIQARLMSRVGTLDKAHLSLTSYGRWDLAEANQNVNAISAFLSGQGDGGTLYETLRRELPVLFNGAADLPFTGSTPADIENEIDQPCTAISLALKTEAYPVRVGVPP